MNNKGFAITTILYGMLILFMMLLISMLGILSTYSDRLSMLIDGNKGARDIINGVYVYNKDDLIIILNDRNYYKAYDGSALVAYMYNGVYTGPILVGTTSDSVAYYTTYDSNTILSSTGSITYNGVKYYYSSSTYWMAGNCNDTSGFSRYKYEEFTTVRDAAMQLIKDRL